MKSGTFLQFASAFCLCSLLGCAGLEQWKLNGWEVGPNYSPPAAATADHWIDAWQPGPGYGAGGRRPLVERL